MSRLIFPIDQFSLIVDVLVNVEASILLSQTAIQQPFHPIATTAEIDTGTNISGVSRAIVKTLALVPAAPPRTTIGLGGPVSIQLYKISLHVRDAATPQLPMFTIPSLTVMELPPGPTHDVLIGMDVLMGCRLVVDGPTNQFAIEF